MWLMYEDDMIVGVFSDDSMADKWISESSDREAYEIPLMDKTFAGMTVEYNTKYEQ